MSSLFLFFTGLICAGIGVYCLVDPAGAAGRIAMHLDNINSLNQIRGSGGVTLAMGAFMVMGARDPRLARPALLIFALVVGGLELGRIASFIADGQPGVVIWTYMAFEIFGLLQAVYYLRSMGRDA
ncbi:MAG: DUF4345 domain-containing protein [Nevskia sp.]|nr:DUF4345 domain-containing protein [Nevskia sp.]